MTRVPAEIAAEFVAAVAAERQARSALREALRRQSDLLRRLRDAGVRLTDAVLPVARALGEAATPGFRRRLATRLRKRAAREDSRPPDQPGASSRDASALLPVDQRKEAAMAEKTKLVRRTITEEYVAPEIDSEVEDDEDVEDESDEDDEPRKRRR